MTPSASGGRSHSVSLALPPPPERQPRPPFPWMAALAPLAVTGVLFAVTHSPFVLVFAVLSPVMALAAAVDSLRHARARHRRALDRYRGEQAEAARRIAESHASERESLHAATPEPSVLLAGGRAVTRWRTQPAARILVTLGRGTVPSALETTGADADLARRAELLDDAPVCIDVTAGLGVVGPLSAGRALVRGIIVQLTHTLAPGMLRLRGDSPEWEWLQELPHAHGGWAGPQDAPHGSRAPAAFLVTERPEHGAVVAPGTGEALIVLADDASGVPPSCGALVSIQGIGRCVPLTGEHANVPAAPELVTRPQAHEWAAALRSAAGAGGCAPAVLPERVSLAELAQPAAGTGLACAFSHDGRGPREVDLVRSGPHAVVAGTTGSGKSELLVSWIGAMAAVHSPQQVTFLLVDFKGGSAFAPLAALPHTVGVITDLKGAEAARALDSLRCELRRREQLLARLDARDVDAAGGSIPRLVVVVDEFAAMLEAFPQLGSVFVDIGARGRALGVHLIACTQRATGVFRDSLLANCSLRLSLRVQSEADSTGLLGAPGAARLPAGAPGRCIIAADGELSVVQVASTSPENLDDLARRHPPGPAPWRPWREPLPSRVAVDRLGRAPEGAVLVGLADDPSRAWQGPIALRPRQENLAVIGDRASGKTTLLETVAAGWEGHLLHVGPELEQAWDAVDALRGSLVPGSASTPLLAIVDDLDALVARFEGEYRDTFTERLTAVLRDGPRFSIAVAMALGRVTAALRPIVAVTPNPVVLRQASRSDHVLAGAPAELYQDEAPPGRGVWRGMRLQVALAARQCPPGARASVARRARGDDRWVPTRHAGVVTHRPAALARALRAADPARETRELGTGLVAVPDPATPTAPPVSWVGDPDQWQQHWQLFSRLHRDGEVLVEGCTLAELRGLLRARVLPPPLRPGARAWLLRADHVTRVTPLEVPESRGAGRRAA